MKRIKHLSNYDLIIIPVYNYKQLKIGNIKIKTIGNIDIMYIRYPYKNKYLIFMNMLEIIKVNEYKNILLVNNKILTKKTYLLLKEFINYNNLDIDIIS